MGATTQNQWRDSADWKSLAKHTGQKFLTNPDALGKIGNNREGELAIGNCRELSGPDFSRFFPIILNREKSGVIGSEQSQFLESQLFCKFSAKCQIPNFLRSVPVGRKVKIPTWLHLRLEIIGSAPILLGSSSALRSPLLMEANASTATGGVTHSWKRQNKHQHIRGDSWKRQHAHDHEQNVQNIKEQCQQETMQTVQMQVFCGTHHAAITDC
jgi:hypothetical protein